MNAESTPMGNDLNISLSDLFNEVTPVRESNSNQRKRKYFRKRLKKDVYDESDEEPVVKSQIHESVKLAEGRKTNKRKLLNGNQSKCQQGSDELESEDENYPVVNKSKLYSSNSLFSDTGLEKLLVNLEENADTGKNSKLLDSESLSASDVMKWSNSSLLTQNKEPYFSKLIKKKLFDNVFNKEVIKSQTSGWTQFCNKKMEHDELKSDDAFYGLPRKVQQLYQEHKGIKQLFLWQQDCLKLDAIKQKRNLVYSLPTSGGKSLVAEILILQELLIHHRNVLLILPYVSIVQEKIRDFAQFALEFKFSLEEYAAGKGSVPPKKCRKKNSLMIATIEKGLIIVNSLIEESRLDEIGLLVVDELHVMSEEGRGSTLETLLIQILHCGERIQIIGMTATIGNLEEVASFLKADCYTGNFRPVRLTEYVKCGNKIYLVQQGSQELFKEMRTVYSPNEEDCDGIAQLVQEVIPHDSVLIFCPTKKNCENVAILLSHFLSRNLIKCKEVEKASLYRALVSEMNEKICPTLKQTIPFGIAYHHSGLTAGERKLLEEAFRQGTICVLCCTSTLAAGVNLPAKRVILRSPNIGKSFISLSKYKQMVGRAGRTGLSTSEGESFLIYQPTDTEKVVKLFRSHMDDVISKLDCESIKNLILFSIGLGTATTRETLKLLLKNSLLHKQYYKLKKDTNKIVDECIDCLYKQGALIRKTKERCQSVDREKTEFSCSQKEKTCCVTDTCELIISRLGRAAMKGGMTLEAAHELYEELVKAQASLVLFTNLHLLYLVTPYELITQIKPNFQIFYNVYMQLDAKEIHAARVIGITECGVTKLAVGMKPKNVRDSVLNRFYISLILNELWNQKTVWDVAQLFQLPRGLVQTVMTSAATFVNSVLRFCEELEEFWSFKSLFCVFGPRLGHCCAPELLPLMELPAVKKGRAKQLYDAGFKTIDRIACAQPGDLVRALDHMPRNIACQICAAAKLLMMEKAENLREEAELVLETLSKKYVPSTS